MVGVTANCANDSSFEIGKSPESLYDLAAGSTQSRQRTMTDSEANNPVLTFEGKRYDLNTLPDELKGRLVPFAPPFFIFIFRQSYFR